MDLFLEKLMRATKTIGQISEQNNESAEINKVVIMVRPLSLLLTCKPTGSMLNRCDILSGLWLGIVGHL